MVFTNIHILNIHIYLMYILSLNTEKLGKMYFLIATPVIVYLNEFHFSFYSVMPNIVRAKVPHSL